MIKFGSSINSPLLLGIDIGTSGIRASLVDPQTNQILASFSVAMPVPKRIENTSEQDPFIWINTLNNLLLLIQQHPLSNLIRHLVIDATSSSVLLVSKSGLPLSSALMYDDKRATLEANKIFKIAPCTSGALGASSTLAKVMWLEANLKNNEAAFVCHQADFINFYFTGKLNVTDENNALKLGYDSLQGCWPEWIKSLTSLPLPKVYKPGDKLGKISSKTALELLNLADSIKPSSKTPLALFFKQDIQIYFGTTDSIAAFLATGANQIGDAVTSLGSTLAIKLITEQPIFNSKYGIYSHKIGDLWLAGGASNTGGSIILQYFSLAELADLIPKLNLTRPTSFNYYPLKSQGERFPISDPYFQPKITPRPKSKLLFLQAILEGLTNIEKLGFERLDELGASQVKRIFSSGGGQKNTAWMALRAKHLNSPLANSKETEASFGVTQLIRKNFFN